MPSEICEIPSMKVILIFVHLDHIFKVGKFVFHFDTENWEEQLKKPPSKFIFKSDIQPEIVKHLKIAEITEPVKI